MRGLDTNVLVRYLVADDAQQTALAVGLVEHAHRTGDPLYISALVLCETVWVLSRTYGQAKAEIIRALELILRTKQFQLGNDILVRRSLDAFCDGRGDFADYVIGDICREAGCEDCITFDRGLKGAAGFTLLR
ncbi:MAG TPA: type II toxin-antitoxin system VapC family toxin [Bryobacteraceae bacterium]|nr:type II toxin-antitoxin system VapC family toxin [Bryobacteraceae bacterium]